MTIEEKIYEALNTEVTLVNGRVYPLTMPQDTQRDAVVYQVLSGLDIDGVCGEAYANAIQVQIDVYAKSYKSSLAIKDQIRTAMKNNFNVQNFLYVNIYEPITLKYRQACSMSILDKDMV